jgi:hypothetical protein
MRKTLVLAVGAGLLSTVAVAGPAAADSRCGAQARVGSISYSACDAPSAPDHTIVSWVNFQNSGAKATPTGQEAWSVDGASFQGGNPFLLYDLPAGSSTQLIDARRCTRGHRYQYEIRLLQSNGQWGPFSRAPVVTCQ